MRIYNHPISSEDDVFTVEEWDNEVKNKICYNDHGHGYWVKNNLASRDEAFSSEEEDATHVVWYNK